MGSFTGHALPGSFFIVYALWWTIQIFRRYYRSLQPGGASYRSSVTFPCSCLCWRFKQWEVEGFLKIFFAAVGMAGEISPTFHSGKPVSMKDAQHATMYFFFMMSGIIDILVHHRISVIPPGIEYVTVMLALIAEGILFKFHLHGRSDLDVLIHTFLLYAIYGSILAFAAEMYFRTSLMVALVRAFFTLVHGTWFWQVGFILYNPNPKAVPWNESDHQQMMVATMIFTWHLAAVMILVLLIGAVVAFAYGWGRKAQGTPRSSSIQLLSRSHDNERQMLIEDTESEVEFESPSNKSNNVA